MRPFLTCQIAPPPEAFLHLAVSTAGGHEHMEFYARLPACALPPRLRPSAGPCTLQFSMSLSQFVCLVNSPSTRQAQPVPHLFEVWAGELDVPSFCEQHIKLRGPTLQGERTGRKRLALQATPLTYSLDDGEELLSLAFEAGRLDIALSTCVQSHSSTRPSVLPQPTFSFRNGSAPLLYLDLQYGKALFKGGVSLADALRCARLGCVVKRSLHQSKLD
jgi:hypothetical protein